ncbi:hypothetical protein SKAU_G00332580 [Synaphobranchus kaupii]|uniref:Uncharacterized protein n=1 Tax=Synaphobranchus kaupii TaxID=118154 RepID=A0A9Q1IIF0_SYNKA|nr:hypothetical protein SKAU_G00332580 [Synaphobranchus kaupii]
MRMRPHESLENSIELDSGPTGPIPEISVTVANANGEAQRPRTEGLGAEPGAESRAEVRRQKSIRRLLEDGGGPHRAGPVLGHTHRCSGFGFPG